MVIWMFRSGFEVKILHVLRIGGICYKFASRCQNFEEFKLIEAQ